MSALEASSVDPFGVVFTEDDAVAAGVREGEAEGRRRGLEAGARIGRQNGWEVALEVSHIITYTLYCHHTYT